MLLASTPMIVAAPIFGDYASKKAFNSAIKGGHGKLNKPSMLFRVTNNADIVATGKFVN